MNKIPYNKQQIELFFLDVVKAYKASFNYDISYMKCIVTDKPTVDINGKYVNNIDINRCGGSWTKLKYITININYQNVMATYNVKSTDKEFLYIIIAHELGHEVFTNILKDKDKLQFITNLEKDKFTTEYIDWLSSQSNFNPEKLKEEKICEYLAHIVVYNYLKPTLGLEAMATSIKDKRKKIEELILKTMKTMEPKGNNYNYYKNMFSKMSDRDFVQFMNELKDHKRKLYIQAPNMKVILKQEDLNQAADDLGVELFERLYFTDKTTGKKFLTPYKYFISKLPVRRTRQFLMHKLSVAENDKKMDSLTGQVVADDQASSLSFVEAQLLYARGLDQTLVEFMKVRGGDIHAFATFKQQLEETGHGEISSLDPNTIPRSAVVMSAILKSMYFDNNLI